MARRGLTAVVLDVDGTLADTELDGHRVAFNRAFAELGLPFSWDVARYRDLLAVTGGERRIRWYLSHDPEGRALGWSPAKVAEVAAEAHRRKTEHIVAMIDAGQVVPRPGVRRLLAELQGHGVPMAIATTGTRAWVDRLLRTLFPTTRFAAVVTGDEAPRRKPDPQAHLLALECLGVDRSGVVAVEDSGPGLDAAVHAGLPCVLVATAITAPEVPRRAALGLDGFGEPTSPAAVLADPYEVCPAGVVDVAALRRLASRVGGGFLPFE